MLIEQFELSGRRKRLERRMVVRCHACDVNLHCPADIEQFGWIKTGLAQSFLREHRGHGHNAAGWHFEFIDLDVPEPQTSVFAFQEAQKMPSGPNLEAMLSGGDAIPESASLR